MEPEHEAQKEPLIVVIDHGTRYTKFGLSTDLAPKKVRTVVGYPKPNTLAANQTNESYVGDEALRFTPGQLNLFYPYCDGKINDYAHIEKIWLHVFKVLGVNPKKAVVLFTQSHFGHDDDETKRTLFQGFVKLGVEGLIVCNKSVLPIYQTDKITGLVIDSGEEYTYVAAVYEGHALQQQVIPSLLAGKRVTDFFENHLQREGHVLSKDMLYKIKETYAYVSATSQEAVSSNDSVSHLLPDYSTPIRVENGLITKGPEVLFEPTLGGEACLGLPKLACEVIQKCPDDIRKCLFGHIVLSGGNTLLKGFPERFAKEIKEVFPGHDQHAGRMEDINIVAPSDREFGAWKGACKIAEMPNFFQQCVSEYEYGVVGEAIVLYKYDYGTSQSEATSSTLSS